MRLKNEYMVHRFAGEQIMVPIANSALVGKGFFRSNDTAAFIIDCLQENITISEIESKMLDKYEVDEAELRSDIEEIISQLRKINAIEE